MPWSLIIIPVCVLFGFALILYLFQSSFIYFPSRDITLTPEAVGLSFESVKFKTEDDITLSGWYIPSPNPRGFLLFCHGNAGNISIRFSEKIRFFVKEAELYIKRGDFDCVDEALKKALREANVEEKREIYFEIKKMYEDQAREYLESEKRTNASRIYEKLLEMNPGFQEKKELKEKLLDIYKRLGEDRKYNMLKGLD